MYVELSVWGFWFFFLKKKKKKAEITLQGLFWPKAENASTASHVIVNRLACGSAPQNHYCQFSEPLLLAAWVGLGWETPENMKDLWGKDRDERFEWARRWAKEARQEKAGRHVKFAIFSFSFCLFVLISACNWEYLRPFSRTFSHLGSACVCVCVCQVGIDCWA